MPSPKSAEPIKPLDHSNLAEEQQAWIHLGELTMLNLLLGEFMGRPTITEQEIIIWSEKELERLEKDLTHEVDR